MTATCWTLPARSWCSRRSARDEREWLERRRTAPGRFVGPGVTLLILTLFQAFLTLEFTVTADEQYLTSICLAFLALIVLEWFCYLVMRSVRRTGFEPETIAFFLSTLGMEVCASSTPDEMFRQVLFLLIGVALFFFLGWWLRDLQARQGRALAGRARGHGPARHNRDSRRGARRRRQAG